MRAWLILLVMLCALAPASAQDVPPVEEGHAEPELTELDILRLAETEIFGALSRAVESAVDQHVPDEPPAGMRSGTLVLPEAPPEAHVPPQPWLEGLAMPDLPVRWHPRVVRFLDFFKNDRRGRNVIRAWMRRSTRYRNIVVPMLQQAGVPEDLYYVAMIESGYDPSARSGAAAVGLWQFVAGTGRAHDLTINAHIDERRDVVRATEAAISYLTELKRSFGSWELALAAYNMGSGALRRAMRKYSSNDYWMLSDIESGLPFETSMYVAKIIAVSIIGNNPERFGLGSITHDPPVAFDTVLVGKAVSMQQVARAAGVDVEVVNGLNLAYIDGRTPDEDGTYRVHIPAGTAGRFGTQWERHADGRRAYRLYTMRFGETLRTVGRRFRISSMRIIELNRIEPRDRLGPGTLIMVPARSPRAASSTSEATPVVAVPPGPSEIPGRVRVFYRTTGTETPAQIATAFGVTLDELRSWNRIDNSAGLIRGMVFQVFAPSTHDLSSVIFMPESDVEIMTVGSDEFFEHHEAERGRRRVRYTVRSGDTLTSISQEHGLRLPDVMRINNLNARTRLRIGQTIILYIPEDPPPGSEDEDGEDDPDESEAANAAPDSDTSESAAN